MYSRIPVRWQLRVLVGAIVGLMLLGVGATVVVLAVESRNITQLTRVIGPAREVNSELLQAMTDAENALASYQVTRDPALLTRLADARRQLETAQRTVRALLAGPTIPDEDRFTYARLQAVRDGALSAWLYFADRAAAQAAAGMPLDSARGQALAGRFRTRHAELAAKLYADRDELRTASRDVVVEVTAVALATTAVALLGSLIMARRTARSLTTPVDRLRAVVQRVQAGEQGASADEHRGTKEVRELAAAFNTLAAHNHELTTEQAETIRLYEAALRIERELWEAGTADEIDVVRAGLGAALRADRVEVNLADGAADGAVLWRRATHLAVSDTSADDLGEDDWIRAETAARAVLVVPIGIGERALGTISVAVDDEPHRWTAAEIAITRQVAATLAHSVAAAEHRERQARYVADLENLDRQKDGFIATISHELRTPLTSINGFLELLLDDAAGEVNDQQRRMLGAIERNTIRLGGLIDDLLVVNYLESGALALTPGTVAVGALAEQTVEELRPLADKGGVRLELHHPSCPGHVHGDRSYLHRALCNVVSNAIKFTPDGGLVRVSHDVDPPSGDVVIRCADNGIGIPEGDIEQLDKRFFRARNAAAKEVPGSGLGLSIVRAIVDAHSGRLEIASQEGTGTTVTLRFASADRNGH